MVPAGGERAAEFTMFIDAIDIAIGGGTDEIKDPVVVGGTLLVQAAIKGGNSDSLKYTEKVMAHLYLMIKVLLYAEH